jgi:cyclohexadieny/prephenate dehydrogenase
LAADGTFKHLGLVGCGLIGSSILRAVREGALVERTSVFDRDGNVCAYVQAEGLADAAATDPGVLAGADLVLLCVPVGAMGPAAASIAEELQPGAVVSDVGSVKASVIEDVSPHLPGGVAFIPAHPIAGTEHSGPAAGFAGLFQGRWVILCPPGATAMDEAAAARVEALWHAMGAQCARMSAAHHDQILGITSHLPHLIAYTIVGTATDLGDDLKAEIFRYSAGGFRDFTRLAASDPIMWRDVFLNNREAVLELLQRFSEDLSALQKAIRRGEADTLERYFEKTRTVRRGVIDAQQER